jgi:cytochrome P450
MLSDLLPFILAHVSLLLPLITISYFLSNKYRYRLNKYPGPHLAAYTDLWRFLDSIHQKSEKTFIDLHRQHGDIVRIGPNVLSFADPQALKSIYGLNKGFVKSDFYPVQQGVVNGRRLPSLFSSQDETYHARYRRCVNGAFSMSNMVSYEPLVESTLSVFLDQTEKLFESRGSVCNFGRWLQFFAFDVIGELTWSKRIGFIERNEDVSGIIGFIAGFLEYAGPVCSLTPFSRLQLIQI